MGYPYPILKNWSAKRSGAAMTVMATDEAGQLVKLTAVDIRKDDGTLGKTLATIDGGAIYELT